MCLVTRPGSHFREFNNDHIPAMLWVMQNVPIETVTGALQRSAPYRLLISGRDMPGMCR